MTENHEKTYIILNADKYRLHFWSRLLSRLTGLIVALALLFSFVAFDNGGDALRNQLAENTRETICRSHAAADVNSADAQMDILISQGLVAIARSDEAALLQILPALEQAIDRVKQTINQQEISITACEEED